MNGLLELKWWPLTTCFEVVMEVILFAFHKETGALILMKLFCCIHVTFCFKLPIAPCVKNKLATPR